MSPVPITQAGTYNLVIDSSSSVSQNYGFQMLDASTAPEIEYGLPVNGSLANGRQGFIYNFQAKAGEKLYFDSLSSNTTASYYSRFPYRWQLYSPSGQVLYNTEQRYDFEYTITQDGRYSIYVAGEELSNPLGLKARWARSQSS
jgi:large repetitive protein